MPANPLRPLAENARAWPFEEARKLVERIAGKTPDKGYVLLETGYGPSGLPHIGTFGEVVRTTMVRRAFETLSDVPTRLFAFSDDMDGLRKVPDNIPNRDLLQPHLGKPLTRVPDPFGTHESFGHHNNARLRAFLDSFGFDYEFKSATECYASGEFDAALLQTLRHYDKVIKVVLPTLGGRAAGDLLAVPAGLPAHRRGPASADRRARPGRRHGILRRSGDRRPDHRQGHRRSLQTAVEVRLGDALVRAGRRLRDVR